MQTGAESGYVVLGLGRWDLHLELAHHESVSSADLLAAGPAGLANLVQSPGVVALPAGSVEAGGGNALYRAAADEPGLDGLLVVHSGRLANRLGEVEAAGHAVELGQCHG